MELRSGMIRYAFERGHSIQIFVCLGYDYVLHDKLKKSAYGDFPCIVKFLDVIKTSDYKDFD